MDAAEIEKLKEQQKLELRGHSLQGVRVVMSKGKTYTFLDFLRETDKLGISFFADDISEKMPGTNDAVYIIDRVKYKTAVERAIKYKAESEKIK